MRESGGLEVDAEAGAIPCPKRVAVFHFAVWEPSSSFQFDSRASSAAELIRDASHQYRFRSSFLEIEEQWALMIVLSEPEREMIRSWISVILR